jgi:hypothetical protein
MTTYRRIEKAAPSLFSYPFDTYNDAVRFCKTSALLKPSKPFKKGSRWMVSIVNPAPVTGKTEKVENWVKPGVYLDGKLMCSSYDDWRGVEGLNSIPAHVTEAQVGPSVHKANQERMVKVGWKALPKHVYEAAAKAHA